MIIEVTNKLVINYKAREWCQLPYPGHPKGCPNYGKRLSCPPKIPLAKDIFDLKKTLWFVINAFNLAAQAARMKTKHPEWSERQCRCCLYWQKKVNNGLKMEAQGWSLTFPGTVFTLLPEAMGVNVLLTLRRLEIPVEIKNIQWVRKVALLGYPAPHWGTRYPARTLKGKQHEVYS